MFINNKNLSCLKLEFFSELTCDLSKLSLIDCSRIKTLIFYPNNTNSINDSVIDFILQCQTITKLKIHDRTIAHQNALFNNITRFMNLGNFEILTIV